MSHDKRDQALFHMGYEWWMFRAADDLLQRLPRSNDPTRDDDPVRNALVESLAVHGRGLAEFFYMTENEEKAKKKAEKKMEEEKQQRKDLSAEDLGMSRPSMPKELHDWWMDASSLVHTSARRLVEPLTEWDVPAVRRVIKTRVNAVRQQLGVDMPKDWIGDRGTESVLLPLGPVGPTGVAVGGTGPAGP